MNSLALRAVIAELHPYRGLRLESVGAADPWEIHLRMEKGVTLVACAHPEHNAFFPAPAEAVAGEASVPFARALEKALAGSRLAGARQAGLDRALALRFERRDRLGDVTGSQIIVELTGKGANLVLVDGLEPFAGRVLDRLREDRSRREPRDLSGGASYRLTGPDKADAAAGDEAALARAANAVLGERDGASALVAAWTGMDPAAAALLWSGTPDHAPESLARAWLAFLDSVRPAGPEGTAGARFQPTLLIHGDGKPEALVFAPPAGAGPRLSGETRAFPTASAATAAAHRAFRERHGVSEQPHLVRPLRQAQERTEHALEALERDVEEAARADEFRRAGEAVLAAAHDVPRGASTAEVRDHRSGETLTVELDPALNAAANAERYFKRARKAERSGDKVDRRRRELEKRRDALAGLRRELDDAGVDPPPAAWFDRALRLGVKLPRDEIPAESGSGPDDGLSAALRPRRYDLGDGWEALVGKSNRGNEVLTLEIARPGDTWMHADQVPGSHVVLRHHEKGKEPPKEKVLAAAAIAAWFSKARNAGKVPILITEKRQVRKPRKAPVGTVTVGVHKTILVGPRNPDARSGD